MPWLLVAPAMCIRRSFYALKYSQGSALAITVVVFAVLLGFLGVSVYTGLNSFLQNELQKTTSSVAMAGASAMYDDLTSNVNPAPVRNDTAAVTATTNLFSYIVGNSPPLTAYGAAIQNPGAGGLIQADGSVEVASRLSLSTPFFAPLGINNISVDARSRALPVKMQFGDGTVANAPVEIDPKGVNTGLSNGTAMMQYFDLPYPVIDGPGVDLMVKSALNPANGNNVHGVIIEGCSGLGPTASCYDLTEAVRFPNNQGVLIRQNIKGVGAAIQDRWVAYGQTMYIDMGAVNSLTNFSYNRGVTHISGLRIIDDGIPDQIDPTSATRFLEVQATPPTTLISQIEAYHFAVACPPVPNGCAPPATPLYNGATSLRLPKNSGSVRFRAMP
ncbi:MAG: hypothetical protein K2X01_10115 [Cyanobacteria bacterium]|nr:hypothetical protein [Cyanobacteriota bacterium]